MGQKVGQEETKGKEKAHKLLKLRGLTFSVVRRERLFLLILQIVS